MPAMQRGNGLYYIGSLLYSRIRRGCYPRAVPSGAARGAHHPAGTQARGDIQAVTAVLYVSGSGWQ